MIKLARYKLILITFSILIFYSCTTTIADKNAEQLKNIKIGMTEEQVKKILGKPIGEEIPIFHSDEYEFTYEAPTGYSDNFKIFFSRKDSLVIRIGDGL